VTASRHGYAITRVAGSRFLVGTQQDRLGMPGFGRAPRHPDA
jgi:hypothetical protein